MKYLGINKLFSKSFMGSMLFAIALWGYTSLNGSFVAVVQMPVGVKLPEDRALENSLPSYISVEVRGTGWNLFNLIFFNSTKKCLIDLSRRNIHDSVFTVTKSDILNGIQALEKVDPKEIYPDIIHLKTGMIQEKEVPITTNVRIYPSDGFMEVGDISIMPDKVLIKGNRKVLDKINNWSTSYYQFEDINKPFSTAVNLKDSAELNIKMSFKSIFLSASVEQKAEIEFIDIPISVMGSSLPKNTYLYPRFVKVTLSGGIEELAALEKTDIIVSVEYSDLIKDSTGIIIPSIDVPKNIKVLSIDPSYIYQVNRSVVNKISDLNIGY